MSDRRFEPSGPLGGSVRVPGDKSISHRAALLAAMGEDRTRIDGYLDSEDTNSTLAAIEALGAAVSREGEAVEVAGVGLRGARAADIDVGNAGTLLRLLPGWLAGQPGGAWNLDGDASIRRRPVDRIAEPLRAMGAAVEADEGLPPLRIEGRELQGIEYDMPVASAQVKSCVLLAGLLAEGATTVTEATASRDHTERMLAAAGADIEVVEDGAGRRVTIRSAARLEAGPLAVPADFSSAAFLLCAAVLVPGSEVRLPGVGVNATRTGLLRVLERMGADVELEDSGEVDGEPSATLVARHSSLRGTSVTGDEVPALIDELPLVALLGAFAEGETVVTGAAELRRKESDRIETVAAALRAAGASIEAAEDGWAISGGGGLRGGGIDAAGDHRIAMLGAVTGLASREGVEVRDFDAATVSYPAFGRDLASLAVA